MNFQQTLDYMYSRLPMFSRVGADAVKSGFANITALCEILGNPHRKTKFIHVAGTNGKGSVSHMLAAIFQSGGYNTGLYTSPHLKDFRERIKVNGKMIAESRVVDFIERMKPYIENIQPSFFEITVAMAFDHFAAEGADIAIIETGLGGRLDSTNIIKPVLSVVTNIGWDHVQILGDTLEKIAAEKAGIIKPGVPVVVGEKKDATESVFRNKAAATGSALFFAGDHYQVGNWLYEDEMLWVEVGEKGKTDHNRYCLDLTGQYQIKNLVTVLESCRQLRTAGYHLPEEIVMQGLKHVRKQTGLHGRWEIIQHQPKVVLDVAHNESGIQELLNQLETSTYHQLHIILGMVMDKDVDMVLNMLPHNAAYYFTNAHIPRALNAVTLKDKAALYGLKGSVFENVNMALAAAKAHAHNDDLILVCGSVFLVGEVKI
ncbi:bifunctional folylpolyglutamate synthase/dihydrofolate synthase [Niabella aquatica]